MQFYVLFCCENDIHTLLVAKNDLRTSSGKFLCVEFCHPENSDFLGLCYFDMLSYDAPENGNVKNCGNVQNLQSSQGESATCRQTYQVVMYVAGHGQKGFLRNIIGGRVVVEISFLAPGLTLNSRPYTFIEPKNQPPSTINIGLLHKYSTSDHRPGTHTTPPTVTQYLVSATAIACTKIDISIHHILVFKDHIAKLTDINSQIGWPSHQSQSLSSPTKLAAMFLSASPPNLPTLSYLVINRIFFDSRVSRIANDILDIPDICHFFYTGKIFGE